MAKKAKKVGKGAGEPSASPVVPEAASNSLAVKKKVNKLKRKGAKAGKTLSAGESAVTPSVDGSVCSTAVAKKKRKKSIADVRDSKRTGDKATKRRKTPSRNTERDASAKIGKELQDADDGNISDDSFFAENEAGKAREFKVWIADLPQSCSEATLRARLEKCGKVARLDMPRNSSGSTGKAFASFYNQEAMDKALRVDGTNFNGQPIRVKPFSAQSWWKEPSAEKAGHNTGKGRDECTAFVGGLPWDMDKELLAEEFKSCGEVQTIRLLTHPDGTSKGMAFIVFHEATSVEKALVRDGEKFRGRYLRVDRVPMREGGVGAGGRGFGKGKGKNKDKDSSVDLNTVFVGNLAPTTEEDQLRADFAECGEVQAVRLVRGQDGRFRGAAFVVYKEHWAAEKALEWNAQDYNGRTLKIAQAKKGGGRGAAEPASSKE